MESPGMCRVSVVIAAHNEEARISTSLESMLRQDLRDFEIIVVDDGSTDGTAMILSGYSDPRIRAITNGRNLGLTKSLNHAIRHARGEYIARLDAGDKSSPERLRLQWQYLEQYPDCVLLGCSRIAVIDPDGDLIGYYEHPADDADIRRQVVGGSNPFTHSSVMFRRAAFDAVNGYDESYRVSQDFDLWLRMLKIGKAANITGPTVYYYIDHGLSITKRAEQRSMFRRSFAHYGFQEEVRSDSFHVSRLLAYLAGHMHLISRRTSEGTSVASACFNLALKFGNRRSARKWLERMPGSRVRKTAVRTVLHVIPKDVIRAGFSLLENLRSAHWRLVKGLY